MMEKNFTKEAFLYIAILTMVVTGCTKNYYIDCPEGSEDENRITLSSEVYFGQTPRVQDEQIVNGQSLSLFVISAGSINTEELFYQNNRITANGMGGFTYRIPMFYPYDGTNVDFYAVHPYYADADLNTAHTHAIQTNQTTLTNHLLSDLLYGTRTNVIPQTNAVTLTFYHKLSKLDFIVTTSDPDIDLTQLTGISVLSALPETSIKLSEGIITPATGIAVPIAAYNDPAVSSVSKTEVKGFTAIIIPQAVPAGEQLFQLNIGDKLRYYTPGSSYTFDAGKKYIVTLDVSQSSITITSQVVDWEEGGSIGGPTDPQ